MKSLKIICAVAIVTTFILTSCDNPDETKNQTIDLVQLSANAEDTLVNGGRVATTGHSGSYVFKLDSMFVYAANQSYSLNDSLMGSNLLVIANLWVKVTKPSATAGFALAFTANNEMVSWNVLKFDKYVTKQNEWVNLIDSITILSNFTNKPSLAFSFFGVNPDKNGVIELDDINITIKKLGDEEEEE